MVLVSALPSLAAAEPSGAKWVRERGSLEWVVGTGGWRTGLGVDAKVPGFDALGGGTELVVGLDVYSGLGVVLDGRFLGGVQGGGEYLEGLGGLGLQLRVSDTVRVRAGAAAGRAIKTDAIGPDAAVIVGGWLAGSIDLFALGGGRLGVALSLRLDVDGLLDPPGGKKRALPDQSLALALGLGLRY